MELHAVEGKLSPYYNYFSEYEFEDCLATDTRLMGVVACLVTWRARTNSENKFYQIIHFDYSEYGIDDYSEYECIYATFEEDKTKSQLNYRWNTFTSSMGGSLIHISPEILVGLYESAKPLAGSREREYDNPDNAEFRVYAQKRLDLMVEELRADGKLGSSQESQYDAQEIIELTSRHGLTACETINYFLMRFVDQDYEAAHYLSSPDLKIKNLCPELSGLGIQTLYKNKIKLSSEPEDVASDGVSHAYRCSMVTLATAGYYYTTLVIFLSGDYHVKDSHVTEVRFGSVTKLSDYEAAVQARITEYITVFDCHDKILNHFNGSKIKFLEGIDPQRVNNGWLYTVYNPDNSHVNSANYWLNGDVYGYAILTIDGEFVLMSNRLDNILKMDDDTHESGYAEDMRLDGRYQLDDPIFHTLCNQHGIMFRDLIDHGEKPR